VLVISTPAPFAIGGCYHSAEMTSPLPRLCANAASSLTWASACNITLLSSLRDFVSCASIRCHVSVLMISSADVAYPCAARLLQQHPVRTPGYQRFSPAVLPECCCSCGLRSSLDCPRRRHPDLPSLASCRCQSASVSKSRCWYIAQCKGHRRHIRSTVMELTTQ
jgi:hypothetical protein